MRTIVISKGTIFGLKESIQKISFNSITEITRKENGKFHYSIK